MQKIGMLQAFAEVTETEDATFVHPQGIHDQSRLIKMRVLSENPVKLYIIPVEYDYELDDVKHHHDEPEFIRFLTAIEPGLDQIEFYWKGSFCLRVKGGSIWLDTYDNTAFNVESANPDTYARLWEREERDPRILEIERLARHNRRILEEQMARDRAEYQAMRDEMTALRESNNVNTSQSAVNPPAGGVQTSSASVPPTGDSQQAPAASGGNGGEQSGEAGQS